VRNENEVKEEYYEFAEEELYEECDEYEESKDNIEEEQHKEEVQLYYELADGEGHWMIVARARRSGREPKAITKKAVKKKKKDKNVGCLRVQTKMGECQR